MQYENQIAAWVNALNEIDRSFFLVFNEGTPTETNKFADEKHATLTRHRKNDSRYGKYQFHYNFWPDTGGHLALDGDEIDIAIGLVENDNMRAEIHSIFPYMNDNNTIDDMTTKLVRDITRMIDTRNRKQATTRREKGNTNIAKMMKEHSTIPTNDKGQTIEGAFYPDELDEYMTSVNFIKRVGADITPSFLGKNANQLSKFMDIPTRKNDLGDFPINEYRTDILLAAATIKTRMQEISEEYGISNT